MTLELRKTSPEPLSPTPFDIPQSFKAVMGNGMQVVIFEDPRLPLVSPRLAFNSGDIHEPAGDTRLTRAVAAMPTEGAENYTSRQLAERVERLGANLSTR